MTDGKLMTCCFSGHRKIPPEHFDEIARRLESAILTSIKSGYRFFGAGGALGFDTLAAQVVLKLKKAYPEIKLILVLPCYAQASKWTEIDKIIYEEIKSASDKIVYTSEYYYDGCMQKRNRHLIDCSSLCICYLTQKKGGTFYTVQYAKAHAVKVINVG